MSFFMEGFFPFIWALEVRYLNGYSFLRLFAEFAIVICLFRIILIKLSMMR